MKTTHKFVIKRRNKIISRELPLIFGISGVARCGKDTFAKHLIFKLEKDGFPCLTLSFASAMKHDIDDFLKEKLNISAFTTNNHEKEIIRPIMVAYATDVWRKIDPEVWIKKLEKKILNAIDNKIIVVIPDVRYENEAKFIKQNGGFLIHVKRMGQKPANFEEKSNDPIVKKLADHKVSWKTFTDEKETCNYHLGKLFCSNNWSTYGQFK